MVRRHCVPEPLRARGGSGFDLPSWSDSLLTRFNPRRFACLVKPPETHTRTHTQHTHTHAHMQVPLVSIDEGANKYVLVQASHPRSNEVIHFVRAVEGAEYHKVRAAAACGEGVGVGDVSRRQSRPFDIFNLQPSGRRQASPDQAHGRRLERHQRLRRRPHPPQHPRKGCFSLRLLLRIREGGS